MIYFSVVIRGQGAVFAKLAMRATIAIVRAQSTRLVEIVVKFATVRTTRSAIQQTEFALVRQGFWDKSNW